MGTPSTLKIRVEQELLDEWKAMAAEQGESLSEFVRSAMARQLRYLSVGPDEEPGTPEAWVLEGGAAAGAVAAHHVANAAEVKPTGGRRGRGRGGLLSPCPKAAMHRAGQFCRYCGQTVTKG